MWCKNASPFLQKEILYRNFNPFLQCPYMHDSHKYMNDCVVCHPSSNIYIWMQKKWHYITTSNKMEHAMYSICNKMTQHLTAYEWNIRMCGCIAINLCTQKHLLVHSICDKHCCHNIVSYRNSLLSCITTGYEHISRLRTFAMQTWKLLKLLCPTSQSYSWYPGF